MEKHHSHHHATHWNSFWFGFMVALATVLTCLLILTITEHISFDVRKDPSYKKTERTISDENTDSAQSLTQVVTELELDATEIHNCVLNKTYAEKVVGDTESGTKAGVKGTPHSFVLIDEAIYEIPGNYEGDGIREFFDDLLASKKPKAKDISSKTDLAPVSENDWKRGKDDARITVIIYSDMDCPYCKTFHATVSNMMPDYSDTVRWVFRHMPVDTLHPNAREKAETAECIGKIGGSEKFWAFLDIMYTQK